MIHFQNLSAESQFFLIVGVSSLCIAATFYWFAIALPRRETQKLLRGPATADRSLSIFQDIDPSWIIIRLLPSEGWKTAWSIETSDGLKLGKVLIKGRLYTDTVELQRKKFEICRYVEGPVFRGYDFTAERVRGKLEIDGEFSLAHRLKVNFGNLCGRDDFEGLRIQSDRGKRLVLTRGQHRRGVAKLKIGFSPGHLAISPDYDESELVALLYAMMLN